MTRLRSMLARATFLLIALFWLTMNVLLWRAEFGSRPGAGVTVPAELVWQKILTAPDSSSLVILQHGKRIGVCHWITGVGEQWSEVSDENLPSGVPAKAGGYQLRLEGSAMLAKLTNQVRFEGSLKLAQNREWRELHARLGLRPLTWEIQSTAAEGTVRLNADTGGVRFERVFKFADLRNPGALVREFAGPLAAGWVEAMDLPALPASTQVDPGLKWEAGEAELRVGHTLVKVYRLQTRLLDRYRVTLWVSRVGEILRVELPEDLVFANDQLTSL